MTQENNSFYRIEKIGAISGILSVVCYYGAAVLSFLPNSISRLLGFAFPLLLIIALMGLYHFLKREYHTPTLEIAYIFGIIGSAVALIFIVVQQANFNWHDAELVSANTKEAKSLLMSTFYGANRVQLGMDIAFDLFIGISWFFFGINIARHSTSRKIFGAIICLISTGLIIINLIAFPNPPEDIGLIDLGPFLGLVIITIFIWLCVNLFRKEKVITYDKT